MSRLIVKNLPAYITPEELRKHFEQAGRPDGTLTDVKVAHKQDGTSRRFGFVGYKTDEEASAAKAWFDKTFLGSTRIFVNTVEGAKDAPTPRPNKRRRTEEPDGKSKKDDKVGRKDGKSGKDSKLEQYMDVMQTKTTKGPSWANEPQAEASTSKQTLDVDMTPPEDDEPANQAGMSDLDWMRRHMSKKVDEAEAKVFEQSDDEDDEGSVKVSTEEVLASEPKDPTKETILQTSRLFVRNLTFSCTEDELSQFFSPYGTLSQVHIPLDSATKKSKGLAYVSFAKAGDALAAYEAADRKSFQGRLIHILAAVDRKGGFQVEEGEGRKRTVKGEKAANRKAAAGQDFNWSMLYMNSDAVASSIADRMNIPKSEILNPEGGSDNAAVKLALAETHIIQETKTYLESQGVVLSAFSSPARSDTTILVKNIPYGTTEEQIRELFEPHGTLTRVIVPPAGTMAVVDFDRPADASTAFRAVAYRRLGSSVIYLEKGPLGVFTDTPPPAPQVHVSSTHAITIPEQAAGAAADEEPSLSAGSTLFVKNLAFATTAELCRRLRFARVQTKPDPKRPDARLSMGYGFVGFKDVEGAKKAMKSMQGFNLDGHACISNPAVSKSRTTKMLVKNVPFEATKKDIRELFGAHGQLKSVRLPRKFDSRTRGFAFLDFVSRTEAENAYAALRHTHLLGRHLVLEWAEEGEQDLDVLRKKAGVGFGDGKIMPGRKRKLDMDGGTLLTTRIEL
ncbi:RNA-binding domain-containing protein [Hymenopellis radicata]|nr:RNA-binding domain-containing protein [Hymenopellis radicata]